MKGLPTAGFDTSSALATRRGESARGAGARLVIDPAFTVGEVDERLFGSFVEHMGRAVYGGIYEPGHPTADEDGFRGDVLELTRELGRHASCATRAATSSPPTTGRTASGRARERPTRLDLAWRSIEPNEVGTDEFMGWARKAGTRADARGQPRHARRRRRAQPRRVLQRARPAAATPTGARRTATPIRTASKLWCLGNEMDGPWQIGQKTAVEYGRLAAEAGKAMRLVDPSIELVRRRQLELGDADLRRVGGHGARPGVGASPTTSRCTPTTIRPTTPDLDAYLACSLDLDRMIGTVVATADAVAGRKRSRKRIGLSVDEWNVWHQRANPHHTDVTGPFKHAPPLAEDDHTVADALVVGCLLITLLRHADRVQDRLPRAARQRHPADAHARRRARPGGRPASSRSCTRRASGAGPCCASSPTAPTYDVDGEGAVAGARGDGRARRRGRRADAVRGQPRRPRRCALDVRAARPRRRRGWPSTSCWPTTTSTR